jgi:hypothetical protein
LQRNTASYKNYASASKEQRPLPHGGLKWRGETKSSSQIAELTSFDCAHGLATITAPYCEARRRSDQAFNGRFFFGQPIFNEMALKICKTSLKQRSVSRDVIAMRVHTGDLLINQRRLSVHIQKRFHRSSD